MPTENLPLIENLSSLGAAALIGTMWLWERRQSNAREKQLDDAHARIMADGVKLEALMDLVQKSTETLAKLVTQSDSISRKMDRGGGEKEDKT